MALQTLFLRDFTILDFAYLDPDLGPLGESLYVSVELEGELDQQGFIFDFGPAKKALKALVDKSLDHCLAVPALSPQLRGSAKGFFFGAFAYEAPSEAVVLLDAEKITPSLLEEYLADLSAELLPANVKTVRFQLREEESFSRVPNFRYTHGLRLHEGNCQRLIHGHRNPLEVWVDGKESPHWEIFLAAEWNGIHFAHEETVKNRRELDLPLHRPRPGVSGKAVVEYESPQGFFRAELPAKKIVLLDVEPSIENIARLGAERIRQEGERGEIRVRAYEGLNKGACFTLPKVFSVAPGNIL
jgi:6-pyruvoyl-tetrahydropterin synthase